jgi:hypothetical protein
MFAMKKTAAALALLLSVACASTPMQSSGKDTASGTIFGAAGVAAKSTDAPNYILFSSPNAVRNVDFSTSVYGLNLKGTMTNRGFYPAGKIEGRGNFCAEGKDWLSLSDLSTHKSADGKSPEGSYVLGCVSASGFQPASRDAVVVQ